ncbi:OsmC family protein [Methanospirillum sp.]|uniref:OsmC family protein n=1 Tax=Methanospirillum sp. TaxID=45200 RepID=UPI0016B265B5|nr:OsmC family protein [Methanospirillum sp.]NLL11623.1 OsmC family protein [Methanomicrobiales archaeon]
MSINNIDIKQVDEYEADILEDREEAYFTTKMEGTWQYDESGPQFTADTKTSQGFVTLSLSHPNFSGPGKFPSPMSYGLFWIAGCVSSTFMTAAEKRNIKVKSLKTKIEADLNYLKQFDLEDEPLVGEYRINFDVETDASDADIEMLRKAALDGCLAMYTIQNIVPLNLTVTRK